MSIRSLTDLAVKRDVAPKDDPVPSPDPGRADERRTDALISAIPAEVLALYTAVTAGALAQSILDRPDSYLPFRWVLLGCAIVLTPIAVAIVYKRKYKAAVRADSHDGALLRASGPTKRMPWLEMTSSTLAAAAWFLAMPGSPLIAQLPTTVAAMTSTTIIVGTLAVLWAGFGRPLTLGSSITPFVPPHPPQQEPAAQVDTAREHSG
jgi:hypothetical protein